MHMIRYTLRPERVAENEQLVRMIIDQLRDLEPSGMRYAVYRLDDGVTFIHLISHGAGAGHLPGRKLDALRAFHGGLHERCIEPPIRVELSAIGEYPTVGDK